MALYLAGGAGSASRSLASASLEIGEIVEQGLPCLAGLGVPTNG